MGRFHLFDCNRWPNSDPDHYITDDRSTIRQLGCKHLAPIDCSLPMVDCRDRGILTEYMDLEPFVERMDPDRHFASFGCHMPQIVSMASCWVL